MKLRDISPVRDLIGRTLTDVRPTERGDEGIILCFGSEHVECAWSGEEGDLYLDHIIEDVVTPAEFAASEATSGRAELP